MCVACWLIRSSQYWPSPDLLRDQEVTASTASYRSTAHDVTIYCLPYEIIYNRSDLLVAELPFSVINWKIINTIIFICIYLFDYSFNWACVFYMLHAINNRQCLSWRHYSFLSLSRFTASSSGLRRNLAGLNRKKLLVNRALMIAECHTFKNVL